MTKNKGVAFDQPYSKMISDPYHRPISQMRDQLLAVWPETGVVSMI